MTLNKVPVLLICIVFARCQFSRSSNFNPCLEWPSILFENGGPLSLQCSVKPEKANITWSVNGTQIRSDKHYISPDEQRLIITVPMTTDSGNYSYVATNGDSKISYSNYIMVKERGSTTHPRVVDTNPIDHEKEVPIGTSTNISCTFDAGNPSADFPVLMNKMVWMRNGSYVPDNDKFVYQHLTINTQQVLILEIRNISKDDLGMYECVGENAHGKDSVNITLKEQIPVTNGNNGPPVWVIIAASCGGFIAIAVIFISVVIVSYRKKADEKVEWQDPDLDGYEVPKHAIEYDLFISYSSDDEKWVRETLFENLQKNGYMVNIDFKDFVPGMAIAENIVDSIYKSRKTVVVMSKNFLKSMWGQFELQQAHNKAISQRKDVLILIKYGKCKVPAKLMGKTFLDYTDKAIKPHFWQRFYDSIGKPGTDLHQPEVKGQGNAEKMEDIYIENEEKNPERFDEQNNEQGEVYDHLIINFKNEKNKMEANMEDVSLRPKPGDYSRRLLSTESCESQDSCTGRRISFEEKKPLLV